MQANEMALGFISMLDVDTSSITIDNITTIHSSFNIDRPVLHIINTQEEGTGKAWFIIISGDSRARAILAYGDAELDTTNIPCCMQEMLDFYRWQIESLIAGNAGDAPLLTSNGQTGDQIASVEPLLTTQWGQKAPFNLYCPKYNGEPCLTGCAATALSMIFHHHGYANLVDSIPGYTTNTLNLQLETLPPIDFDWQAMQDTYSEDDTTEHAKAVAQLMRYVGQAAHMNYTPNGSGTNSGAIQNAIKRFGYTCAQLSYGTTISDYPSWASKVQQELAANRPVLYMAGRKTNGNNIEQHVFVIDGYNAATDEYHVNWGWSGYKNCYAVLNALKPDYYDTAFDIGQTMIVNIHPADKAITVDKHLLSFEEYTGYTQTQTITVTGQNLRENIHVDVDNISGFAHFEVTPSVITPAEAAAGKTVTVEYRSWAGDAQALMLLSSNEIETDTITLVGRCTKSDGYIIPDTTSLTIKSTVRNQQGQFYPIGVKRIHFSWQGAEVNNQFMFGAPSSNGDRAMDFVPIDIGDLTTESFTTEIIGDSCYVVGLITCSGVSDALSTNNGDFAIVLSYSFPTPGKHDAILKISHNSLNVKPQFIHLNGWAESPYLLGDANGDSIVDVNDVTDMIASVLGNNSNYINTQSADMNFDGSVDVGDITELIQHILGNTTKPVISTSVTSLDFGIVNKDDENTMTFTVTGTDLTGDLTLTSSSPYYMVIPTMITADEAATGRTVTVMYNPNVVGTHNATISISGGNAESQTVSLTGECVARPTITASPSSWDFGTINMGMGAVRIFTITGNNLSDSISISQAETNGDEYTISPTWLPASGGTVTVGYSPLNTGESSAEFTFSSGETSTSITVTGECVLPTISTSVSFLNFGAVAAGDEKTMTFMVSCANLTGNLTLSSSNSYYTVTPTTITAREAAIGKTVTVKFKPNLATVPGYYNGILTISGGGANSKTMRLWGECVNPVILTSTSSIAFTESGSEQFTVSGNNWPDNLTLTITGSGSQYFSLSKTTISKSEAENGATITVFCNPPSDFMDASAQIVISGGGSYTKTIDLRYHPGPPTISTSATSLNFGKVALGNEITQTFTVTGTNLEGNLTLSSSNPCYTISPTTITPVEAQIGKTVTVTYTPTAAGTDTGTITISGGSAESKTVTLSGTCLEQVILPVIETSPSALKFTGSGTKDFNIIGTNLIGDVTLTLTGTNSSYFHINTTNISMADATTGVTVSVNCSLPSSNQSTSASAQIEINSPGAMTKIVNLYYTASE